MAFDLDNYEPVAARLSRWLDMPTEAVKRVITELMQYSEARCVFKAQLWHGDILIATGWAEETRGEGYVNQTSHFENCETSAIGRALANAGLAGSDYTKRPSREEMQKVQTATTGPDIWPNVVPISQAGQASTKQVNFINTLIIKKGFGIAATKEFIVSVVGDNYTSVSRLTSSEASRLIKALQL